MAEGSMFPMENSQNESNVWQPAENSSHSRSKVRREDISISEDTPFSHPVYKQVSLANGLVNKMTKDQIRKKLAELKMDTRGHKDVLKKRLKNVYKDKKLVQAKVRKRTIPVYDYYLVIDFEATCDQYNPEGFRHEIIEFPAILINANTIEIEDEFHSYVRPVINPKLSDFCVNLTGIQQSQVDEADTFDIVIKRMEAWMESHQLSRSKKFALVTDGPWDMSRFMFLQCQWSRLLFPSWAKRWVNLRKAFCNFYRIRRAKLITMLENLGMDFEGHQHSGLDDTRNIARIVLRLISDGAELKFNEELFQDKRDKNRSHATNKGGVMRESDLIPSDDDSCDDDCESHGRVKVLTTGLSLENDTGAFTDSSGLSVICESCKLLKSRLQSLNADSVVGKLERLNLNEGQTDLCHCGVEVEDNAADDLLMYYALQKA